MHSSFGRGEAVSRQLPGFIHCLNGEQLVDTLIRHLAFLLSACTSCRGECVFRRRNHNLLDLESDIKRNVFEALLVPGKDVVLVIDDRKTLSHASEVYSLITSSVDELTSAFRYDRRRSLISLESISTRGISSLSEDTHVVFRPLLAFSF